jgi:hypothetical protein
MPHLPLEARRAHVFPSLPNSALVSISQFCDNDFEAKFTKHNVQTFKDSQVILQGHRDSNTGLWQLTLGPTQMTSHDEQALPAFHFANNVYKLKRQSDIAQYLHQAACCPVPSTWNKAINAGYFAT